MGVHAVLLPYIAFAFVLLALGLLRSWRVFDARVDLVLAAVLSVAAAGVAGLVDLGTDAPSYREYYGTLLRTDALFAWWDPGFAALAWAFAYAGAPYGVFAFVCVLSSHLIKLHVFNELTSNRLLALFIIFCLNVGEVGFVRQYLAASLVLWAYLLLGRHKVISALAVILLAALMHKTALLAGVVVLGVCYGLRSIKPLLGLGLAILLAMVVSPGIRAELIERIAAQFANYAVEEYVQGIGSGQAALLRNIVKFLAMAAFAAWMMLLPSRTLQERQQNQAARIVIYLSLVSAVLIAVISPVFSRISTFVFPFLALSLRVERFALYRSQLAGQYAASLLLVLYLAAALYPLVEYF